MRQVRNVFLFLGKRSSCINQTLASDALLRDYVLSKNARKQRAIVSLEVLRRCGPAVAQAARSLNKRPERIVLVVLDADQLRSAPRMSGGSVSPSINWGRR